MPLNEALEVSRVKVFVLTVLLIISVSSNAAKETQQLCEIPEYYKRYFELKDLYSFSDNNFSEKNTLEAKHRISQKKSDIHENDLNIVKGNKLQTELLRKQKLFNKANGVSYELEVHYLEAKVKYCQFILSTRLVDW